MDMNGQKCISCKNDFSIDDLDLDGLCYDCANNDPDYKPDHTAMVKELVESTIDSLAAAKHISPDKMKTNLVAEHAHDNPEKYIKEIISQSGAPKKKHDSGAN